ncbi:hypothetical protein D3C80_2189200 [compost metagenome]
MVLNGPPNPGNRAAIERFGKIRVLAEIPTLDRLDAETVAEAAALIPSFDSVFP